MWIKCPYCKEKLVFKKRIEPKIKGWISLPKKTYIKKCPLCRKGFEVIVENGNVVSVKKTI